jgi:hypothetical protein
MAVRPTRAERERRQAKSVSVTMREMETWVGSVMRGEGGQKARFGTVMILKVASLPFDMTRVRLPPSFWLVTVKGDENGWDWFGVAATEVKYRGLIGLLSLGRLLSLRVSPGLQIVLTAGCTFDVTMNMFRLNLCEIQSVQFSLGRVLL